MIGSGGSRTRRPCRTLSRDRARRGPAPSDERSAANRGRLHAPVSPLPQAERPGQHPAMSLNRRDWRPAASRRQREIMEACAQLFVRSRSIHRLRDVTRRLVDGREVEPIGDIDGEPMVLISKRQCECGTPLGSASTPAEWNADAYWQNLLKRMKKRGWSEGKIARWLEAKQSTHSKLERLAHEHADGPSAEPVDYWLDFIGKALEGGARRIGLRVCHGDGAAWDRHNSARKRSHRRGYRR